MTSQQHCPLKNKTLRSLMEGGIFAWQRHFWLWAYQCGCQRLERSLLLIHQQCTTWHDSMLLKRAGLSKKGERCRVALRVSELLIPQCSAAEYWIVERSLLLINRRCLAGPAGQHVTWCWPPKNLSVAKKVVWATHASNASSWYWVAYH